MKLFCLVILNAFIIGVYAQTFPGGNVNVVVAGQNLKNPWAGGFDLPQFSATDVDRDGQDDIVVFDKKSNKWLVFLNEGPLDYKYAPQYEKVFPEIINMGLIRDFNCDGYGDIIAHVNQGIQVFKNTHEDGNMSFVLENSLLRYQLGSNSNNIYKTNSDIIAAEDFDGDGDLDILSFDLLGTTIPYYRNLSVENGFGCDSLIFEENTVCWGNFKEGGLDNSIDLDFSCKGSSGQRIQMPDNTERHSGSTLAVLDDDDDNDMDLLLGDVAFNNLVYLKNGGTNLNADMVSVESDFPSANTSVDVPIYPAAFYLDVNNDGRKDLLVSPNSTSSAVNKECVWYYENTGNSADRFHFKQKDFLVETQIDYGSNSSPTFFDHNADGLLDMIVSNGYIYDAAGVTHTKTVYYENTGTSTNPEFTLVTDNYQSLNNFGFEFLRPTFGDLDNDGDADMIFGEINGAIHYFKNTAGAGNPANFVLETLNYSGIDIGTYSHPQLVDLNLDGLLDLVIGRNAPVGNVAYYKNIGTLTNPVFHSDSVNSTLGGIHVELTGFLFGYSAPFVTKADAIGDRYIYVGSDLGYVHKYKIDQDSLDSGVFNELESSILDVRVGKRSTLSIVDINNDDELDFFFGNARGGVSFYSNAVLDSTLLGTSKIIFDKPDFTMFPNPANNVIVIELDNALQKEVEVVILDLVGKIHSKTVFNSSKRTIDLHNLSSGIYFVNLNIGDVSITKKLVVKY